MTPLDFKKVGPGTCWNELRSDNLLAVPNLIEKVHAAARAIESLRQQLAECQATNGKLRNSLNKFGEHTHTCDCVVDGEIPENEDEHDVCTCGFSKALAIPNDATALNELIAERTASLTAEVERLRLFDNLAKEYGLSVFADITELTAQRDEALSAIEFAYKVAVEHDDRIPFDWGMYCEMLHGAIAKGKE